MHPRARTDETLALRVVHPVQVRRGKEVGGGSLLDLLGQDGGRGVTNGCLLASALAGPGRGDFVERVLMRLGSARLYRLAGVPVVAGLFMPTLAQSAGETLTVEQLLKSGWQVVGFAGAAGTRTALAIQAPH